MKQEEYKVDEKGHVPGTNIYLPCYVVVDEYGERRSYNYFEAVKNGLIKDNRVIVSQFPLEVKG